MCKLCTGIFSGNNFISSFEFIEKIINLFFSICKFNSKNLTSIVAALLNTVFGEWKKIYKVQKILISLFEKIFSQFCIKKNLKMKKISKIQTSNFWPIPVVKKFFKKLQNLLLNFIQQLI